jgi:hypothetical protein
MGAKQAWKVQTVRLTDEDIERLMEVGKKKYRSSNKSQVIRFLIEDAWREEVMRDASRETS